MSGQGQFHWPLDLSLMDISLLNVPSIPQPQRRRFRPLRPAYANRPSHYGTLPTSMATARIRLHDLVSLPIRGRRRRMIFFFFFAANKRFETAVFEPECWGGEGGAVWKRWIRREIFEEGRVVGRSSGGFWTWKDWFCVFMFIGIDGLTPCWERRWEAMIERKC